MKTLLKYHIEARSSAEVDLITITNSYHFPVIVTVDAYDSVVERQAIKIFELEEELRRLET